MKPAIKELLGIGKAMHGSKSTVNSLWQEIALNFYPERADFTTTRNEGEEYSDHLYASYPVLARRELGNIMSSHLRPQSQKWFTPAAGEEDEFKEGSVESMWLEYARDIQWAQMYRTKTNFVKATKEADHDYSAFGNVVMRVTLNSNRDGLLYRNYHLRDCAWSENADGVVDTMFREWNPSARQLKELFPDKIAKEVQKACEKDPEKRFRCMHIEVPARRYSYESRFGKEWEFTSIFVDVDNETVLEEVPLNHFDYIVPRWATVSGSQYGRSMATAISLPDSRTMQVVTRTLREAGEKYVDPPMIAVGDAIRGDIPLYAGGVTIADMEYDEKLGEVLRPVSQNHGAMPIGFEINNALKEDIRHAFFLDKIQLPEVSVEMTAFEVRRRIEEHIRSASPLFEPIEKEYNAPLCELTFNLLIQHGGIPTDEMPETLGGKDIKFSFYSPLSDATDQAEAAIFVDGLTRVLIPASQVDPAQVQNVNMTKSTRGALKAAGWKAEWFNPEEAVDEERARLQEAAEAQQQLAMAGEMANTAQTGAQAMQTASEIPTE